MSPISNDQALFGTSIPGTSVKDTLNDLKSQRKTLQEQMQKTGAGELQSKITSLDKRIGNLEKRVNKVTGEEECQTSKNRKYKDGSDDPGVSFKTSQKITGDVGVAVRGHEQEHVVRERAAAARENKEVVSQSVRIKSGICPECGKPYCAGGETVTVTKDKPENKFKVGIPAPHEMCNVLNKSI